MRLFSLFLCFCIVTCRSFPAQLNIRGVVYNLVNGLNGPEWRTVHGNQILNAADMQRYLTGFAQQRNAVNLLRELGRLILAQSNQNHNVPANAQNSNYAELYKDGIIGGCIALKNHILISSH